MDLASALTPTTAAPASSTSQSKKDMDNFVGTREDFLTILLAQLKHQDPLSPMEGTDFIDSITRLSSVEQAVNQNANLEKIVDLLGGGSADFGSPVSYIDREVEFTSNNFALTDEVGEFSYNLEENYDDVFIIIRNESGQAIFTTPGTNDQGRNNFTWDGKDINGNPQKNGTYIAEVNYVSEDGAAIPIPTATKGVVTGASFQGQDVLLEIGNITTKLDDLVSVRSRQGS